MTNHIRRIPLERQLMKDLIIFDLDGTICDVEHRRKFVASKPKKLLGVS